MLHASHGARHAHGVVGVERLAIDDIALVVQVHVARGFEGRHFPEVQRHGFARLGVMHHHEAAPAQVACVGQRHGQRKANAHGCVHGVAAVSQHHAFLKKSGALHQKRAHFAQTAILHIVRDMASAEAEEKLGSPRGQELLQKVSRRELDPFTAAVKLARA